MSEDTRYNGWTNYETWAANLWVDGLTLEDLISDPEEYDSDHDLTYAASQALESYIDELDPLADQATLFSDLLHAAMREINYYEIAEHYVEDYRYENPIKGSKNNPAEYLVEPDLIQDDIQSWSSTDNEYEDINPFVGEPESFWEAFEACIQHAIDNEYQSIMISWKITESDVKYKADYLIRKQTTRSTKITGA